MSDKNYRSRRRQVLKAGFTGIVLGSSGCSQLPNGSESTATETATGTAAADLDSAKFSFEYLQQAQQVEIRFGGGARLKAGNIQIRTAADKRATWAELGSTVADTDEELETGATAVLGPDILNWNQPVGPEETIRLVYTGQDTPATLGRFTPPETTTLTTTVPPTETPTTPGGTIDTPTETTNADTTPPSITAFSLANPSDQQLRTSFNSNEQLATIQVSIDGPDSTTITTDDFSRVGSSPGVYAYEATYTASSAGEFTATLEQAVDGSGNDGANGESVEISVEETYEFEAQESRNWGGSISLDSSNYVAEIKHEGEYQDAQSSDPALGQAIRKEPVGELPVELTMTLELRNSVENDVAFGMRGYTAGAPGHPSVHVTGAEEKADENNVFYFQIKDANGDLISEQQFTTPPRYQTYKISYDGSQATLSVSGKQKASIEGAVSTPLYGFVILEDDPAVTDGDAVTLYEYAEE